MKKIKPVYVMHQESLTSLEKQAVLDGAKELLRIGDLENLIEIVNLGAWKTKDYRNKDGSLKEYHSVDWYVEKGKCPCNYKSRRQLDASSMLRELEREPWRKDKDHYDILVVQDDIYMSDTNFIIGVASSEGTVVSTYRFKELDDWLNYECIKTETMHELGHVFGLPSNRRKHVEFSLGLHCTNKCIMRQGLVLPTDWVNITKDRLKHGALCPECKKILKENFKTGY